MNINVDNSNYFVHIKTSPLGDWGGFHLLGEGLGKGALKSQRENERESVKLVLAFFFIHILFLALNKTSQTSQTSSLSTSCHKTPISCHIEKVRATKLPLFATSYNFSKYFFILVFNNYQNRMQFQFKKMMNWRA